MTTTPQIIVVTDANVLIYLMHVARLDLCARLPGYQCARSLRGTISLKFYHVNASIGGPKGDINQVAVMGEDDYLRFGRELRQRGNAGPSAFVVPVDEEVTHARNRRINDSDVRDRARRCLRLPGNDE